MQPLPLVTTMMLQKGLNNNAMSPSLPQTAHFHLLHNIMGHSSVVKIVVISSRHPATSPVYPIEKNVFWPLLMI